MVSAPFFRVLMRERPPLYHISQKYWNYQCFLQAVRNLTPWRGAAVGSLCVSGFPRSSAPEQSFQNRIKEVYWIWELYLHTQLPAAANFYSSGAASGALLILPGHSGPGFILQAPLMPEIHDELRQDGTKKQRRQGSLVIPANRWDLGYL